MRSRKGERVSRAGSCDLPEHGEDPSPLSGGLPEINWEGSFRRLDDGRGGTGSRFFNGGSASEASLEMGGNDVRCC